MSIETIKFDWNRLGDVHAGRESLGDEMPVIVYRLFQYTMKDVLTDKYGEDVARDLLRDAGYVAGKAFAANVLDLTGDFDFFVANLAEKLEELKIGILHIEKADLEKMELTLTVSEDLDCSGLPMMDDTVCDYDEGFISGILEAYTGKRFTTKEIDCWATGDRTCRFDARLE